MNKIGQMKLDALDRARSWLMVLGRKTARERLASLLVILADRQGKLYKRPAENGMSVPLPLTREAIAEFLASLAPNAAESSL